MAITIYRDGVPTVVSPTVTAQNVVITVTRQGATGPAGPNNITTNTTTNLSGILKGSGGVIQVAVPGQDYSAGPVTVTLTADSILSTAMIGQLVELSGFTLQMDFVGDGLYGFLIANGPGYIYDPSIDTTYIIPTNGFALAKFTGSGRAVQVIQRTRVFADQTEQDATAPEFIGQLAIIPGTSKLLFGFGLTAGDWANGFTFGDIYCTGIESESDIVAPNILNQTINADGILTITTADGTFQFFGNKQ